MTSLKRSKKHKKLSAEFFQVIKEDALYVGNVRSLLLETHQQDIKDDLVIVMNRDPFQDIQGAIGTNAEFHVKTIAWQPRLIVRSLNEIFRDVQYAIQRFDEIIEDKTLNWPRDTEVHVLENNAGQCWIRMDCLGKKGVFSRDRLIDAYHDYVRVYNRLLCNKTLSLIEKADIIFAALGIALPLQKPQFAYPVVLHYLNQNPKNQSLVDIIQKRFEVLKALYGTE